MEKLFDYARPGATIKPPPPPNPNVSAIENALELTPLPELGPNIFTNTRAQLQFPGARGLYGGCVIAQCLLAAQLTVPEGFVPHSMHCYFVMAGDGAVPIVYHVDIVREGRSFHTRTVKAKQGGRIIFTTTCSFTIPLATKYGEAAQDGDDFRLKNVARHKPPYPVAVSYPTQIPTRFDLPEAPLEWRTIGIKDQRTGELADNSVPPAEKAVQQWVKSRGKIVNPIYHNAVLAYVSDSWFIGTICRVNPDGAREKLGMMVSLDHTIHFHAGDHVRLDEWVLLETDSPWADEERGLVRMKVWNPDGTLLATCQQEGMIRLRDERTAGEPIKAPPGVDDATEQLKRAAKL